MKSINCKGKLIDLTQPRVMAIVNLTPDSFYDGGKYDSEYKLLLEVEKMLEEGADFLDFGAYSSRPGASDVSLEEEKRRLLPMLEKTLKAFPEALISVDTFRSGVAAEAIDLGAAMVNDISAGQLDPEMFKLIAERQVPYVAMHMRGNPRTMQQKTDYDDLMKSIIYFFSKVVFELKSLGVNDIILDPGFGFSKDLGQNYKLLQQLELLHCLKLPLLIGLSRKSMLYKLLDIEAKEALNATTAAHAFALQKGAQILRVHDVKAALECIRISEEIKGA